MSASPYVPDERRRQQGFMALLLVQVFFGLFPVFIKLAGDDGAGFTPRSMASWRMVFAAVVLGSFAFLREGRGALPRAADMPRLFCCALFGIVVNQVLAIEGIVRASVTDAGLLMTLIPVFTYVIAVLVGQEQLRARRSTGIGIALLGALVLAVPVKGLGEYDGVRVFGNFLIMANCVSYALYLVIARPLLARYSALTVIAWVFIWSLVTIPIVMHGQPVLPVESSPGVWWAMAYVLVFPTVLAYLLNTYALARVSASTTAVFIYMQPFVAGLGGWLVFGERLTLAACVAAALLFGGIWLVTTSPAVRRGTVAAEG